MFGKTVLGALIWCGGTLFQAAASGQAGAKAAVIAQAVGGLLGVIGLRHAIAKNGSGQ